jgi:hypothetical protein
MTAAEYREWAREQRKSADLYAGWAKHAAEQAQFWFKLRGDVNSTETWGDSKQRRYDLAREKFLSSRRSLKQWRRLVVNCTLRAAEWEEKAKEQARIEKRARAKAK